MTYLFDTGNAPDAYENRIKANGAPAADQPRLQGQNLAIFEALKSGPKTNKELAAISLKYTSRISDIRAAGFAVECERLGGGLSRYRLEVVGPRDS